MNVPAGYFNQTYAIEFQVEGDLDGTTVSPTVDNSPPSGESAQDPQNLFRRTVQALGLVDPDYLPAQVENDRRGARGNRFISYIWIEGTSVGSALASVDIVDAIEGTSVQKNLGTFVGETKFFREAIFLPQGSMIRVRGLSGSSASPIKVRLHVQLLEDAQDIAAAFEAQSAVANDQSLDVAKDGAIIVSGATELDFVGAGVTVTPAGGGTATVDIAGGVAPLQTVTFLDNATEDVVIGPDTNGYYAVEANISKPTPESSSYRLDFAASSTGVDMSVLEIDSDVALTSVALSTLVVAGQVTLRLTGTGTGVLTTINFRIVDRIVRAS